MFAAEFEPADSQGRRRSQRSPVSFDARVGDGGDHGGMSRTLCKVVDISQHGARLQTYSGLKRGSTIWLTLPNVGQVAAEVMWADDYVAGCQFKRPLDTMQFEALVAIDR